MVDLNSETGKQAVEEFQKKYGKDRVIFVKTDVWSYAQFEEAFKKTIEVYQNIDILINNAGLASAVWQTTIKTNLEGTINGMLLGMDNYLPKYKSGDEGVIVNTSSILGIRPFAAYPVYAATKFAVHGLTLSWGLPAHYDRTKVRVVAVCPGITETPALEKSSENLINPAYEEIKSSELEGTSLPFQKPEQVAPGVMKIIEKAPTGTVWVIEGGEPPYEYKMSDRFEIPKVYLE